MRRFFAEPVSDKFCSRLFLAAVRRWGLPDRPPREEFYPRQKLMNTPQANRLPAWSGLGFITVALIAIVTWIFGASHQTESFFSNLFKAYQPREYCMLNEPAVIWLHGLSDAVIALAYYSIPVALIYFVRRRSDLRFGWMFVCFAVFILACGTTHILNILALWYAPYRIDGIVKLFTAGASIATAITLWPLIPRALALPSPAELRRANAELEREIQIRRKAEESLRQIHADLERRVEERTTELRTANERLKEEIAARTSAEAAREALLLREREARAEAENASRAKDEFLATLSHELRTPLSAITGWTHILRVDHGQNPSLEEGLAVIERSTRVQTQLIEDLLDLSRIISGKLRLDPQPINFTHVVDAAIQTVQPSATAKGVTLEKHVDAPLPPITGDPGRLQQVVWNLLANSIKFTPTGGRVEIVLKCTVSNLELTVSDNGAGISPDFLPHVFERFRQADSSATRKHGGLGIGLALVKHLVELHGGTVRASSPGLAKGSTFVITLPLHSAPSVVREEVFPPASDTERNESLRLDGITVLAVDDEADSRDVVSRILRHCGATVVLAESAERAFALLQESRPDLLVCDIGMPEEDGHALLRRVRSLPPEHGGMTPAIALTAFARAEDRVRALRAGFQMHLAKPIDPAELVLVLLSLVKSAAPRT
jgi:signal transduction histidine kinase/CheY-like chemotaxis protein